MPLTNLSDIENQEKLFQQHISDFIKPRTENSTHPKECIELLRFRFSEKLGLSPRVNFFAFNSVKELMEKREELEKLPNYDDVDKKINRYQPRAALNAYEKFLTRYGTDAKNGRDSELDFTIDWGKILKEFAGEHDLSKKVFIDGFLQHSIIFKTNLSLTYEEIKDDLYVFLSFPSGKEYGLICKNSDDAEKPPYIVKTESNWPKKDSPNKSLLNYDGPICAYYKISTKSSTCKEDAKNCMVKLYQLISSQKNNSEQQIFFGAPGTGKSHTIKSKYLADVPEENIFRTTFHPDYDYAQFVGSYKPKKNGSVITYDFVPQVFAKAYKRAKETSEPVYLVIEEINRGNCAQIFGDIFQLLDRNESGESQYEIDVDSDFAEWLGESKIKLPPNFNILATMNTSDQSLFPMDSAFKRRFDWEYVPIRYVKDSKCGDNWNADGFEIKLDEHTSFSWLHFLKKINADIYKVTESEDKQMGEFFVKPKDNVIDLDMFRSKVLFYLWDTVYKDEPDKKTIFHFNYPEKNGSRVTFQSLFGDDANAIEIIKQMMKNLDKAYESKDDSEFKNFKIVSEQ